MPTMVRETWTDERLDDLNKKVDDGFIRIDSDIRELRHEVKAQGTSLHGEMNELRREMNERFDSAHRTLIGAVVVIVAAILGSNAF